jgi:Zn-dependent metalloprotease
MKRISHLIAAVLTFVVALGILVVAQLPDPEGRGVARSFAAGGRDLREWDDRVATMERTRELRLRTTQVDTLLPGRTHERLDQYYKGVPVFGGEAVRETDGKVTLSVTAALYSGVDVDTSPVLSAADAAKGFMRETGAEAGTMVSPQLMILPRPDGTYALTYRMTAPVRRTLPVVFLNANTGAVELRYNNLQTQQATALVGNGVLVSQGLVANDQKKITCALQTSIYLAWDMMRPITIKTYDLKGNFTRADSIVNGQTAFATSDLASNTGATWTDSVVVDGHTYVGWAYDYFYQRDGWKGFDGNNVRSVSVIVHPVNRADLTKYAWADVSDYYVNAFFCPQCGSGREDILMFGEGLPAGYRLSDSGQYVDYFVAALGIVAHEYSHGVTDYTANLIYQKESGALSEAFSDIMGQSATFFHRTTVGSGLLQADYLHGKETFRPGKAGSTYGLRNLANPAAFGDPDHYSKRYIGTDDNGGVHTNSTIASHAFYLAIEGGTNRTSGLFVTGVGSANRDKIEKAFFRGFTTLTSNATFSLARAKTIQAARDLYGAGGAVEAAIIQAWNAVGVN